MTDYNEEFDTEALSLFQNNMKKLSVPYYITNQVWFPVAAVALATFVFIVMMAIILVFIFIFFCSFCIFPRLFTTFEI